MNAHEPKGSLSPFQDDSTADGFQVAAYACSCIVLFLVLVLLAFIIIMALVSKP
jgi:hypothetical protein